MEIENKIITYLNKIKKGNLPPLAGANDVVSDYVGDSLSKVKMLIFLEREYGFRVEVEEIDKYDFSSVKKIADLVRDKIAKRIS